MDRMTGVCKNITFPQLLLRTVTKKTAKDFMILDRPTAGSATGASGVCSFCQYFAKLCGAPGFWENVLDSFSYFNIEIAYLKGVLVFMNFSFFSLERKETGSLVATENEV